MTGMEIFKRVPAGGPGALFEKPDFDETVRVVRVARVEGEFVEPGLSRKPGGRNEFRRVKLGDVGSGARFVRAAAIVNGVAVVDNHHCNLYQSP